MGWVVRRSEYVATNVDNHKAYHAYGKQWLVYEGGNEKSRLNKIKNVLAVNALRQTTWYRST